jgi:hypothetical protein
MQKDDKKDDRRMNDDHQEYIPGVQEKSTIGGAYNTGVTSSDPEEKEQIEKKASLAKLKPKDDDNPPANSER